MATETQGTPEGNKPNANKVVQGLLAQLGKPTQPTQPPASAASVTGAVTEVVGRASDVEKPHSEGLAGEVAAHAFNVQKPQKPTPEATAAHSLEVDCRYCGGCCGGRRGRRLPRRVYDFVAWVAGVRGVAMCQVVNEFPELFCKRLGRRGHGVNRVKELERLLSREGEYKASYVLDRLRECLNDAVCWRYLRLGVEGWFRVVHLLANRAPGDVDGYFSRLVRGLGFNGVVEASRYLRLVVQSLVDFNYVNRGRGYRDVLSVRCRLCGGVIDVTGPLPGVLFTIVNHFRVEHGLKAVSDIEGKVKEIEEREASRPEGDDTGIKLLRNSAEFTQLVRLMVHRLVDRGLLERIGKSYRCRACNADVGDAVEALVHVMDHHYDIINKLLGGRAIPSARGINDAVDELANMLNHGNPDAVKPTVKALVQGIIDVLNARGSASVRMLTRWLSEDDDYRLLLNSLTTGSLQTDRVVVMIIETMARHGLVHVDGEVVRLGE
ncbi:MAG: hypothetical protein RXQ94_06090 [Caldivirga sp.]